MVTLDRDTPRLLELADRLDELSANEVHPADVELIRKVAGRLEAMRRSSSDIYGMCTTEGCHAILPHRPGRRCAK